jgi:hypothetical protein
MDQSGRFGPVLIDGLGAVRERKSMAHYRLYFLKDGHIAGAGDLEADDDPAAIFLVRAQADGVDCELWCGTRRVAHFQASLPTGASEG